MTVARTPEHGYFLGKLDPVPSPFSEFKTYFTTAAGPPPPDAHFGHLVTVPWQMDGNGPDPEVNIAPPGWGGCGDCVEAYKAHGLTNANYREAGHTIPVPTPDDVVDQYSIYSGCTPAQLFADPDEYDNGEVMSTSLTGWCQKIEYGCKVAMTAPINSGSMDDIKNGIALGGGIGLGVQLQEAQELQYPNEWSWVPGSPIIGGHAVWVCGYDPDFFYLVTWGVLLKATYGWVQNAADEAHAVIFPQAVAAGKTPSGLNLAAWEADLAALV